MTTATSKRYFVQILPFGVISALFGIAYTLIERGILGDNATYPSTGNPYFFSPISSAILSFIAGMLLGAVEVLFLNRRFQKSSFTQKLLYKTLIYMVVIAILIMMISIVSHAYELNRNILDPTVLNFGFNFLNNFAFWTIEIYIGLGVLVGLFYAEVRDNIGQGVLNNFLIGTYHQPIEEDRIFMFLDMKDSTTIAEKLGHVEYFKMLKEYYADLTDPIVESGGEIYQYVGDEVVVTWKLYSRKSNSQCLQCFFLMKAALEGQGDKYQSKYGLKPTFKAGIHLGQVTTGEIGVVKKAIIFSGDVLNTTARIQGLCNKFNTDLLVSEQLMKILDSDGLESEAIGYVDLRGRAEKVRLFKVVTKSKS